MGMDSSPKRLLLLLLLKYYMWEHICCLHLKPEIWIRRLQTSRNRHNKRPRTDEPVWHFSFLYIYTTELEPFLQQGHDFKPVAHSLFFGLWPICWQNKWPQGHCCLESDVVRWVHQVCVVFLSIILIMILMEKYSDILEDLHLESRRPCFVSTPQAWKTLFTKIWGPLYLWCMQQQSSFNSFVINKCIYFLVEFVWIFINLC